MSTPRRRRHSAAVYRRRRVVLLLVLVLIGVGIWLAIARPWSQGAEPDAQRPADPIVPAVSDSSSPEASGTSTPSDEPLSDEEAAKAKPCAAADIEVEPHTDKSRYGTDERPELTVTVRNAGTKACKINVGTTEQVFTITSGKDTWWRSTDCQSEPSDMVVALAAGQTVSSSQPIVWDRTRSSVATCQAEDRPAAPGDGATYHLAVSVGGVPSADSASFILG